MPSQSGDLTIIYKMLRVQNHQKQERMDIGKGVPSVQDLREGVSVIRRTQEGMVKFTRIGNVLYKNVLERVLYKKEPEISLFADDGYIKFGNGLIMQWGQETSSSSTETVTFPISFPNSCLNVVATAYESGSATGDDGAVTVSVLPTIKGVTFGSKTNWDTFFWQAIGY